MEVVESAQTPFLIRSGVVVILLVLSFLFMIFMKRKARAPKESHESLTTVPSGRPAGWDNYKPRKRPLVIDEANLTGDLRLEKPAAVASSGIVYFNWNGHSWNAFEVLGLNEQACSPEQVEEAFAKAIAKCDPESLPFLRAAYDAIMAS